MTCLELQRLIIPYIEDKLDIFQTEEFIKHMGSCESCMEELEVYYTLLTGMMELDEYTELSYDFHKNISNKLKVSESKVHNFKLDKLKRRISFVIMIIAVLMFIGLGIE